MSILPDFTPKTHVFPFSYGNIIYEMQQKPFALIAIENKPLQLKHICNLLKLKKVGKKLE